MKRSCLHGNIITVTWLKTDDYAKIKIVIKIKWATNILLKALQKCRLASENKDVKNLVVTVLYFNVLYLLSHEVLWIVAEIFNYLNFDAN